MTNPPEPFAVRGGCNCGAYRFQVSVPALAARAPNPYRIPGSAVDGDPRLPFAAIDHCNDCRRATGSLLSLWYVTQTAWVTASCALRSDPASRRDFTAEELFDFEKIGGLGVFVACYKSSPQRSRWFCSRCGTGLAYTVDPGALPAEWGWPAMLDICLGTVDREDLEKEFMEPERQLWCDKGIPWVKAWARRGGAGIPEHPTTRINECADLSQGIDEILRDSRSHLKRVAPEEALSEHEAQSPGRPVVLVDIRPAAQREAKGMIEGALIVERNVLEWRFDPRSDAKLPAAGSFDLRVIVFCQEGYTSSLAAKSLQDLGLWNATDMAGGYKAWRDARLPDKLTTKDPACLN